MQCDDGCILRVTGCGGYGGHHNAYRICGTDGQIENLRGMYPKMMLRYDSWNIPAGMQEVNCYDPKWNDPDEELIETSGHGGGDYVSTLTAVIASSLTCSLNTEQTLYFLVFGCFLMFVCITEK